MPAPHAWHLFAAITAIAVIAASGPVAAQSARIVDAIKNRDVAALGQLVASKADVNQAGGDGATALHWAAHVDSIESADLLLKAGAQVDAHNVYGVSPLMLASLNGSPRMVTRLLDGGANPNTALPSGETVLMTAARVGNTETVRLLLAKGADVKASEKEKGQNALMWAAAEGHAGVVALLLEHGADPSATSASGFTPLLFAARSGTPEVAAALLKKGANIEARSSDQATPLILAAASGNQAVSVFLLENGADPNAVDKLGMAPLHAAVWKQYGNTTIISALLAKRANPNARVTGPPPLGPAEGFAGNSAYLVGATPFILAAAGADAPVMRILAANGVDTRLATNDGTTPLMAAAGLGWVVGLTPVTFAQAVEATALAIELGNDVNAARSDGATALHGAARNGADPVVQLLVDKGANVNVKNKRGQTPLYIAGHAQLSASLIEHPTTVTLLRKLGGVE